MHLYTSSCTFVRDAVSSCIHSPSAEHGVMFVCETLPRQSEDNQQTMPRTLARSSAVCVILWLRFLSLFPHICSSAFFRIIIPQRQVLMSAAPSNGRSPVSQGISEGPTRRACRSWEEHIKRQWHRVIRWKNTSTSVVMSKV